MTREAAQSGIRKKAELEQAIVVLQDLYDRNFDAVMKVSWKNFPSQSGHMYAPGCFRCHDGKHKSDDGTVLSKDCSLCHLIIKKQLEKGNKLAVLTAETYPHPVDIGDSYKEMNCSDCH